MPASNLFRFWFSIIFVLPTEELSILILSNFSLLKRTYTILTLAICFACMLKGCNMLIYRICSGLNNLLICFLMILSLHDVCPVVILTKSFEHLHYICTCCFNIFHACWVVILWLWCNFYRAWVGLELLWFLVSILFAFEANLIIHASSLFLLKLVLFSLPTEGLYDYN